MASTPAQQRPRRLSQGSLPEDTRVDPHAEEEEYERRRSLAIRCATLLA